MCRHRLTGGKSGWLIGALVVLHAGAVTGAEPADVPSGRELVDLLKNDRVAMDLIRKDTDLVKEINRRPTLVQVIRELRSDPHVVFYRVKKTLRNPWVIFGFGAQVLFLARFVVQWIASERRKRSHVPVAFWYLSLAGGITLFIYAVGRFDPVFMLGQGLGCLIYIRNLILIYRRSAEYRNRLAERAAS